MALVSRQRNNSAGITGMKRNMTGFVLCQDGAPRSIGGGTANCSESRILVHHGFEVAHVERLPGLVAAPINENPSIRNVYQLRSNKYHDQLLKFWKTFK